jgi:CHASE2 domain-containing sensor protein
LLNMPLIRLNLGFRPWPRRSIDWSFDGPLNWPLKWSLDWSLDWPLLCRLGGITLSVTAAVSALTGNLQGLEWASLDQAFRWRPVEDQPSPILLVTIDEADLTELGRWPIDDRTVAQVLTTLKRHQPSAIGLDLYRNLPVEPGGAALRQVFTTTPNLIGIQKAVGDLQGPTIAGPALLSERGQVAANDLVLDADGKLRRNLLSIRYAGQPTQLALGTQLALIYLQQRHQILPQTLSQSGGDAAPLVLGRARLRRLRADEGGYRGIDVQGYQTLSNFLRVPGMRRVSLRDVLADRVPPDHIPQPNCVDWLDSRQPPGRPGLYALQHQCPDELGRRRGPCQCCRSANFQRPDRPGVAPGLALGG